MRTQMCCIIIYRPLQHAFTWATCMQNVLKWNFIYTSTRFMQPWKGSESSYSSSLLAFVKMTDNKAPPMILFPALSCIFVRVERCVQLFSTFPDQQSPTFPPPPQKDTVEENLSLPEPLFESDSLSVHVLRATRLSDSWRHVAIGQKYKWDRQSFCGGWTCLSVRKFVRAECVRGSPLSFLRSAVNVLKCGLIFTKDRNITTELGARSDVKFKMATFRLAAGKARRVCQLPLAFLAKTRM